MKTCERKDSPVPSLGEQTTTRPIALSGSSSILEEVQLPHHVSSSKLLLEYPGPTPGQKFSLLDMNDSALPFSPFYTS